jgi:DNA-binding MarR family transcriptional regulator
MASPSSPPYVDPFGDGRSRPRPDTDMDGASSMLDATFRLERAVTRIGNARLAPWRLTLSSYTALRILAEQPHLSLAQLARRCYVRPQTLTRMVAQLEERGLVARGAHPESERAVSLRLTDAGMAALHEMSTEVLKISETLNATLGQDSIAAVDEQLRQAAVAVENELRAMNQAE